MVQPGKQSQATFGFLLQFDGGAGICIFRVRPGQLELIEGFGYALSQCADNIEAEAKVVAFGVKCLATILEREYTVEQLWTLPIFVQGDIQPVIRLLAHHGRLKRLDVVQDLQTTQLIVAQIFRCLRW